MSRIAGVFNNEKAAELVFKGLKAAEEAENENFWIFNDERGKNSFGCSLCSYSQEEMENMEKSKEKIVADAEIYNFEELKLKIKEKSGYEIKEEGKGEEQKEKGNAKELLFSLLRKNLLDAIDGAYAFAHWRDKKDAEELYIVRDRIGLKPVWYSHHSDGFAFASSRKMLEAMGFPYGMELEPRRTLRYDIKEDKLQFLQRNFFSSPSSSSSSAVLLIEEEKGKIKNTLLSLLTDSISKRIRIGKKFGVLFSGGLDSSLIAYICNELGADFVCYTVAFEGDAMKEAEDLEYAKRIAKDMNLELRTKKIGLKTVENYLEKVVSLIESTDVVKVGVAMPIYVACEIAREEGMRTLLYGLGSEELFAGYERHRRVPMEELNEECLAGILRMHERDLYRDEMVAKSQSISLKAPFLSKDIVDYSLKIPASYKLSKSESGNKLILRELAMELGLEEVARREKKAVQYGSNFIKVIEKLAKRKGYKYKRDYLRTFYPSRNIKLGCFFSSGKDSTLAFWMMLKADYPVECLITIKSKNPYSYMFHTPAISYVEMQAEAIGIPLIMKETEGEKEKELHALKEALREAKKKYGIEGVVSGALWSEYQKGRIEKISSEEGLKVFLPLWHINQETEMRLAVSIFNVIFTGVSAYGLDKSWLGRRITEEDVDRLVALNKKEAKDLHFHFDGFGGINIAGEGGEFESFVLDGPMFKKKIEIVKSEIVEEDENTARLVVKEAKLREKDIKYSRYGRV